MELEQILSRGVEFRYQLLDRMRDDCNAYLGCAGRDARVLWAKDAANHMAIMEAIWDSFTDAQKPAWITERKINALRDRMIYVAPCKPA